MSSAKRAHCDPDIAQNHKKAKFEDNTIDDTLNTPYVTSQATPTLLGIPRELRDMIYEYVIGGHEVSGGNLYWGDSPVVGSERWPSKGKWQELFSLSVVCHQLNEETKLLPYSSNIFGHPVNKLKEQYYEETFLGRLKKTNKDAIHTVSFGGKYYWNALFRCVSAETVLSQLDTLAGLKTMVFYNQEFWDDERTVMGAYAERRGLKIIVECYDPATGARI